MSSTADKYLDSNTLPEVEDALKIAQELSNAEQFVTEDSESDPNVEEAQQQDKKQEASKNQKPEESDKQIEEAPILTADGKHTIPYDVLRKERQAKAEALAELDRIKADIEDSKAKKELSFEVMSQERLDELKDYFPEEYEIIGKQQQALIDAQKRIDEIERQEQQRQREEALKMQEEVQALIESNPRLLHWQTHNPDIFERAIEMENIILKNPDVQALSMKDRFDRVADAVAAVYGDPVPKKEETKKPVDAKSTKANRDTSLSSLSEIPGVSAEASEFEKLENVSTAELGAKFARMSEDERNKFLNSLG